MCINFKKDLTNGTSYNKIFSTRTKAFIAALIVLVDNCAAVRFFYIIGKLSFLLYKNEECMSDVLNLKMGAESKTRMHFYAVGGHRSP